MAAAQEETTYKLPPQALWQHLSKLAIVDDKPIMLDYWPDSLEQKVFIGVKKEGGEKLLIKSAEEYTSPVSKIYKTDNCYIICTENSIYLVSSDIKTKHING